MSDKKKYFLLGTLSGIFGLPVFMAMVVGCSYLYFEKDIMPFLEKQADQVIQEPSLPSEEPADYNWKVVRADGSKGVVDINTLKGKTIFVNVWATWCLPCIVEMKYIEKLYSKVKDEVVFIVVSEETTEVVSKFAADKNYTFPMYAVSGGKLPKTFKMPAIPATLIVSPFGSIVFKHMGSAKWDSEKFIRFIKGVNAI